MRLEKRFSTRSFLLIGIIITVLFFLFPIYWMFTTAIKERLVAISTVPKWIFRPTFKNFYNVIFETRFPFAFLNSFVIAISTTMISLFLGLPAAYSLSRCKIFFRKNVKFWILSVRMFPPVVICLPFFMLMSRAHIIDTHIGVVIAHMTFILPFTIWMMKIFFDEIPEAVEEAALMDGCSRIGVLCKISIPLGTSGIIATAILSFLFSWNEYFFALILTANRARTLPVELGRYIQMEGVQWGPICAISTISIIPIFILMFLVQKHLIRGLTFGAIK